MKSYYGNLVVDIFELIFAIVSLLLVWVSCAKDSILFFGITAIVYMLPRFLTIILGIVNNARDIIRLRIDVVSLVMLFISFIIVCIVLFDSVSNIFPENFKINTINTIFYIVSSISLSDIVYKTLVGLIQKFSITNQNHKSKSY